MWEYMQLQKMLLHVPSTFLSLPCACHLPHVRLSHLDKYNLLSCAFDQEDSQHIQWNSAVHLEALQILRELLQIFKMPGNSAMDLQEFADQFFLEGINR